MGARTTVKFFQNSIGNFLVRVHDHSDKLKARKGARKLGNSKTIKNLIDPSSSWHASPG
jgi:hypothetical protein